MAFQTSAVVSRSATSAEDLVVERIWFNVRVIPRASRISTEARAGELIVRVTAAPVDGAANDAVIRALATALKVRHSDLVIESGARSRRKIVSAPATAAAALASLRDGEVQPRR